MWSFFVSYETVWSQQSEKSHLKSGAIVIFIYLVIFCHQIPILRMTNAFGIRRKSVGRNVSDLTRIQPPVLTCSAKHLKSG